MEKIEPFSDECKFGKNGIWLFIGPQCSGKTYKLIQTIANLNISPSKEKFVKQKLRVEEDNAPKVYS